MVRAIADQSQAIYDEAFTTAVAKGKDLDAARTEACREMHQAGYFRSKDGTWEQLASDLRGKVNIRDAEEQPDGTFVIRDVDAFYPNAVKGGEDDGTIWTRDRVMGVLQNSNRARESGGQPTSVTKGHVYPEQKMMGISIPAWGEAINWRESPRGEGWARCDLIRMHPEVIKEWREGKIKGLSAGFVQDAGGTNERIGHVAMLGGESQALSALPKMEIYSASGLGQLCYSADVKEVAQMHFAAEDDNKGLLNPKTTLQEIVMDPKKAAAMQSAYSGMASAYAGLAAGEPGADEKVAEAHAALDAAVAAAEAGEGAIDPGGQTDVMAGRRAYECDTDVVDTEEEEEFASQEAQEETFLPKKNQLPLNETPDNDVDVAKSPGSNFSAAQKKHLQAIFAAKDKENHDLRVAVTALVGRQIRSDFSADVQSLIKAGHQIDFDSTMKMFEACDGKKERMTALMNMLKKTPKSALRAPEPTFGATNAPGDIFAAGPGSAQPSQQITQEQADSEVLEILQRYDTSGYNYTSDDVKMGTLATGGSIAGLASLAAQ